MYYVIDEKGNRKEAYDKEEVMAVLQQAIADGSLSGVDAQSAFVSKLKCCVDGGTFKQAFVTQAKYNELEANKQLEENTIYNITDDNSWNSLLEVIESHSKALEEMPKRTLLYDDSSAEKLTNEVTFDNLTITGKKLEIECRYYNNIFNDFNSEKYFITLCPEQNANNIIYGFYTSDDGFQLGVFSIYRGTNSVKLYNYNYNVTDNTKEFHDDGDGYVITKIYKID